MKFVIAPDSFKESMSAKRACDAIKKGILDYDSSMDVLLCPMADGGEGTLDTLVDAMHGYKEYYEVTGPLFEKIKAPIGYVQDIAIIECAKVCGLELLSDENKNPLYTTTYGLGELITYALNQEVKQLFICLGGSGTNDGGIGMLSALGVDFLNVPLTMAGLPQITKIDFKGLDHRLLKVNVIGVCDVKNPLCGNNGATAVYGPQKGLKYNDIEKYDRAMKHYATIVDTFYKQDFMNCEGAGAAGGLGYALLSICQAKLQSGFDVVAKVQELEDKIKSSDIVIVGEGKLDNQTQFGKTPYGVLELAKKYQKPIFAYAGRVEDHDVLKSLGFFNIYEISPRYIALHEAISQGENYLRKCVYEHMEEMLDGL